VEDRERIEAAVRRFFEPNGDSSEYATGRARRYALIVSRASVGRLETKAEFRRLETVEIDARRAVVDVDVIVRASFDHPLLGPVTQTRHARGPVELALEDGEWKVADHTVDGRTLADSAWEPGAAVEQDGVSVSVPLIAAQTRATRVFFDIRNERPRPLVLVDAWRGRRTLLGRWRYAAIPLVGRREAPARETTTSYAGWRETFPTDLRELRVVLRAAEADGPARLAHHISITRDRIWVVPGLPLSVRIGPRTRRTVAWLPLAALVVLMLTRALTAAAFVTLAYAAYLAVIAGVAVRDGRMETRSVVNIALAVLSLLVLALLFFFL
jgi:hypothetical protein